VPEFKILFLQFSDEIKHEAFRSGFSYRSWKDRFLDASTAGELSRYFIRLSRGIRRRYKTRKFLSEHRSWRKGLRGAVSISEIAEALYKFEVGLKWQASSPRWQAQRNLWVKKIQSLY
jgi:hypothetical protein